MLRLWLLPSGLRRGDASGDDNGEGERDANDLGMLRGVLDPEGDWLPLRKPNIDGGTGSPSTSATISWVIFPLWCQSCGANVVGKMMVKSSLSSARPVLGKLTC